MPYYEMIMLCKVGESQAMGMLLKTVTASILEQGGNYSPFPNTARTLHTIKQLFINWTHFLITYLY